MKTTVLTAAFICIVFVGFGQGKNYKNQINPTLKENVFIEQAVIEKPSQPSQQTPKYKQNLPNLLWADSNKLKKSPPSYKQHEGRPNT
jgi:hypothetical protein